MNNGLYFEGKKYISSKRAAEISGYANDYIGQLCRAKKLESKIVGRSWFVSEKSLNDYLRLESPDIKPSVYQSQFFENNRDKISEQKNEIQIISSSRDDKNTFNNSGEFVYLKDKRPLIPEIIYKKTPALTTGSEKIVLGKENKVLKPINRLKLPIDKNAGLSLHKLLRAGTILSVFILMVFGVATIRNYSFVDIGNARERLASLPDNFLKKIVASNKPRKYLGLKDKNKILSLIKKTPLYFKVGLHSSIDEVATIYHSFADKISIVKPSLNFMAVQEKYTSIGYGAGRNLLNFSYKFKTAFESTGAEILQFGNLTGEKADLFLNNARLGLIENYSELKYFSAVLGNSIKDSSVSSIYSVKDISLKIYDEAENLFSGTKNHLTGIGEDEVKIIAKLSNFKLFSEVDQISSEESTINSGNNFTKKISGEIKEIFSGVKNYFARFFGGKNKFAEREIIPVKKSSSSRSSTSSPSVIPLEKGIQNSVNANLDSRGSGNDRVVASDITRKEVLDLIKQYDNNSKSLIYATNAITGANSFLTNQSISELKNKINSLEQKESLVPRQLDHVYNSVSRSFDDITSLDGVTITNSSFSGTTGTFSSALTVSGVSTSTFAGGVSANRFNSTATSTLAGLVLSSQGLTISTLDCSASGQLLQTDANGNVICGTDDTGSGGGTFSWTPTTNYGALTNATGTPIWFQSGLQASSTSHFVYASTTALTILGNSYLGTVSSGVWNGTAIGNSYVDDDITLTNLTQITNRAITDTTGTLTVARGGTGQTSFGQGWLHSDGTTFTSSTSPTVAYLTATSTTATSTFAWGLQANALNVTSQTASSTFANGIVLSKGCILMPSGTCLGGGGTGTVTSIATNNGLTGGTITDSGTIGLNTTGFITNGLLTWDGSNLTATGTPNLTAGYFTATTTTASTFPYASTTMITATTASSTNLIVSGNSTLGTVVSGIWNGTSIGNAYVDDDITLTNITQITNRAITDTTGTLTVARGGTGQTSFGQGWLHSDGTTFTSSTSPTVNYLVATSTTATSTFAWGLQANALNVTSQTASSTFANGIVLSKGCVLMPNGTCLGAGGGSGTVTSVDMSVPSGLTISGNPITTSGTLALGVSMSPNTFVAVNATGNGFIASTSPTVSYLISTTTTNSSFAGNLGIGTTSPNWKLSVTGIGSFDDNVRTSYFTATSTTASAFPYASTTALTISGNSYLGTVSSGTWNGSTMGVSYGGTGWAAIQSGYIPFGNGSSALATSTSLFWNSSNSQLGIGTSTPYSKLTVWGSGTGASQAFEVVNNASTTLMSILDNGTITLGKATAGNIIFDTSTTGNIVLVGMGTSTPDSDLTLVSNQTAANTYLFTIATTTGNVINRRFIVDSDGDVHYDGTLVNSADYAESFSVIGDKSDYEPGDIIVLSTSTVHRVVKSSHSYQDNIIGVYSTKPGIIGSLAPDITDYEITKTNDIPVGMLGRVPVKVNAENGEIKIGDKITTSSQIGVGMKSDNHSSYFGIALEPYSGEGIGKIIILLSQKENDSNQINNDSLFSLGIEWITDNMKKIGITVANGVISLKEVFAEKITAKKICLEDVCIDKNQLKELLKKNGIVETFFSSSENSSSSETSVSSANALSSSSSKSSQSSSQPSSNNSSVSSTSSYSSSLSESSAQSSFSSYSSQSSKSASSVSQSLGIEGNL